MPRIGMESDRRRALIAATVEAIHECGFCDVTVSQIAKRAGVSGGLALHYFGSKSALFAATMGSLLTGLGEELRQRLETAEKPRDRISAIIAGNFAPDQFNPSIISAWLAFYLQAQSDPTTQRLLRIYSKRLVSNLTHEYRQLLIKRGAAKRAAEGTAAMIDGLWLQRALADAPPNPRSAIKLVEDYVERQVEAERAARDDGRRTPESAS